jgi:hypothetical protein
MHIRLSIRPSHFAQTTAAEDSEIRNLDERCVRFRRLWGQTLLRPIKWKIIRYADQCYDGRMRNNLPSLVLLAQGVGFTCFPLGVKGIEGLVEAFFGRFPSINCASGLRSFQGHFLIPFLAVPKKAGPDQWVPVIAEAMGTRLLYFLPWCS